MGLRDDMEMLERHIKNGTAREYIFGLPHEQLRNDDSWPSDPSTKEGLSTYQMETARGD